MTIATTASRPAAPSVIALLVTAFSERLARHRAYWATRDELAQLSDRDLSDLGIFRADIPAIARQVAFGV